MKTLLVTDLGGTKSRCALLREDLVVAAECERPTEGDRHEFLASLTRDLRTLRAAAADHGLDEPTALGVGTAGVVRTDRRVVHYAPNLPIPREFDLAGWFEDELGLPVVVVNDGRASAVGEHAFGAAGGADPLLALFFGTGIGIGLVVGDAPYEGHTNAAGEVGHTLYRPGGRRCSCGRDGCFEAYCAGGPMTVRAATEMESRAWTVDEIVARAADPKRPDPRARSILEDAELAAGTMVANLCTILNPQAVVLGGGVLRGWPQLAESIESHTRDWCAETVTRDLVFVPSRGGSDAILWGAAASTGHW